MFDHSVIAIKIIPNPYLSSEAREKAFADSNELVRSVQRFIDDLMKEHMTATFTKAPVVCYIPCSQCKKMHLSVEKAAVDSSAYCPVSRVHADITNYHRILSGVCVCVCVCACVHRRRNQGGKGGTCPPKICIGAQAWPDHVTKIYVALVRVL